MSHQPFVTITHGMSGFFAVLMQWNEDGFYEPWNTGFGRYKSYGDAIPEAKSWATDEGIDLQINWSKVETEVNELDYLAEREDEAKNYNGSGY